MGIKLGLVIADLLEKVGKDPNGEEYKAILGIQSEIPEETVSAINGLMTEQAAKNNLSIKNHFIHSAYNPLDNEIHNQADLFELSDEDKDLLKSEKSTGKKQKLLFNMLQNKLKEKVKDKDPDSGKFKTEIENLRKQLSEKETEFNSKLSEKDSYHKNYVLGSKIESEFSKHPWSENYAPEMRSDLAKIALNKYLSSNGAKLALDEQNNLKIVKADNEELEYFDNSNKKVTFTELAAKLMADNKFLRVSPKETITNPVVAIGSNPVPTTPSKSNNTVLQALRRSQQDQQA